MKVIYTTLYVVACVAICMGLLASCIGNPAKNEARSALVDEITRVILDSGVVPTVDQLQQIDKRLNDYESQPDGVLPEWAEVPLSIAGAMLGVKVLPTRFLQGPFDHRAETA